MSGQASGRTPPPRPSRQKGRATPPGRTAKPRPAQGRARPRGARRPWWRRPLVLGPAALLVVAAVVVVVVTGGGGATSAASGFTVANQAVYGGTGPEGVPLETSPVLAPPDPALGAAPVDGVVCGATEQLTVHVHTHLQIFVNGQPRAVPLAIGMVPPAIVAPAQGGQYAQGSNTCLFWLHTHAQDGIIHVEAPLNRQFVLGQFFDIWGQPLTPTRVGPATGPVTVTLNGRPFGGDPRNVPLGSHEQIVVNVGAPVVTPPTISFSGTQL